MKTPESIVSVSIGGCRQPPFGSFYMWVLKFRLQIPCKFSLFSFSPNKCARLGGTVFTLYIYLHVLGWKTRGEDDLQMVIAGAGPRQHPLHLPLTVFLPWFAKEMNQQANSTSGCEG